MDRLTQLAAFVRLVDSGSQTAAARHLGLTPAMVGRHLQSLEDRLGTRLLNRTTRQQSLTEAGQAYYDNAVVILELMSDAEGAATSRLAEPRGTLRVAAPMDFGTRYLAQPIKLFCEQAPKITIELALNDRVVDLVEEGYDLALRIGELKSSTLVARRLMLSREAVCASPSYLALHGEPQIPADLSRHNCLRYSMATTGSFWRFKSPDDREIEVKVGGNLIANSGTAMMAAALAGQGIILLPTFLVGNALREGRLTALLPAYTPRAIHLHAVYPAARNLAPKVRRFIDFLTEYFGGSPPWEHGL